ncbi:MAG TPA: 5-nitroimidazole antibiotic resistance protein [Lachnospiraceae bacterium]|nr:5-nitroimidazole antibiotic resistance protein [Lachnospiraceae bacterium]
MFREMLRIRQKISREECIDLLKEEPRGVLSVLGDDDYPYGMPINHYYCEEDGKLYFHSGMKGHKIDAIRRHDKASFCVYDSGYRKEGEWALNIRSVIVFGRIEIIEDKEKIYDIARRLSYKFTDDESYIEHEIKHSGPRTFMFALVPEHISGKLVNEA